jgi:hypothetical protein
MQRSASILRPTAHSHAVYQASMPATSSRPAAIAAPTLVVAPGPCGALRDNQPPARDNVRLILALAVR